MGLLFSKCEREEGTFKIRGTREITGRKKEEAIGSRRAAPVEQKKRTVQLSHRKKEKSPDAFVACIENGEPSTSSSRQGKEGSGLDSFQHCHGIRHFICR